MTPASEEVNPWAKGGWQPFTRGKAYSTISFRPPRDVVEILKTATRTTGHSTTYLIISLLREKYHKNGVTNAKNIVRKKPVPARKLHT